MLAFVSVCAPADAVAAQAQHIVSTATTATAALRPAVAPPVRRGRWVANPSRCLPSGPTSRRLDPDYFFEQWILVVVLTVEPSSKLISEAPGQYPSGQVLGVMMPLTWNSLRLPWTFL